MLERWISSISRTISSGHGKHAHACCVRTLLTCLASLPLCTEGGVGSPDNYMNHLPGQGNIPHTGLFLQGNHSDITAQAGATANLHCQLSSSLADGMVSWVRRRDYHLLTVGRQAYSSDQRVGVKVSPDSSDWVLTIRFVAPHDAGQYECQVSSHPPQYLMVNLHVVEAHAEIQGKPERHIHVGSSLHLKCLLRGATEPPVYVFWYRGDRMINYDDERGVEVENKRTSSELYIRSVTRRDEGNYTCFPSNATPASVAVHVIQKENPAGLQQETNAEGEESQSSTSATSKGEITRAVISEAVIKRWSLGLLFLPLALQQVQWLCSLLKR